MIERDDDLQKVLRAWEAPAPDPRLDERVWKSFRQSAELQRGRWARKWLPVAAGLVLCAGLAMHLMTTPGPSHTHSVRVETTADATGFTPVPDGAITVVKEERRR
jgi:hypothetical protein